MRFLLGITTFTVATAWTAVGDFGLCLSDIGLPTGASVTCDPPNTLPQFCQLNCAAGFVPTGATREITCMNSICTNTCQALNRTCIGSVPVIVSDADGTTYTEYVRQERPCCALTKPNAPACNLGSCTGNCGNPGVYTFEAKTCPDVCIPYREPETIDFTCNPCVLPELPFDHAISYMSVTGSPPTEATVGCTEGSWGSTASIQCTSTGVWTPVSSTRVTDVQCHTCSPHTYPLQDLNNEMFDIQDAPGRITVTCREDAGFLPSTWLYTCDPITGVWTSWVDMECQEIPEPSVTPTSSPSPSSSVPAPSPSSSKTPRPPKVKGSRAPTPMPKIRGSRRP